MTTPFPTRRSPSTASASRSSRVIAGPWCGALLADLGADVVKVEDTGPGDESRTWPPHKDGEAAAYLLFNRNKRGIALDLKTPEAVEVVKRLVKDADVVIENFRTGTMESFGLGYDVLSQINPRLIYCSVSAFGRTGPRKDSPGYEALMQAFSGIMSITGEPGGQPVRAGVSFLDLTTGILCALGVSNAIIQRERTGLGQRVDGSLLETAVSLLAFHAEGYLLTGALPRALGSGHPSLSPIATSSAATGSGSSSRRPTTASGRSSPRRSGSATWPPAMKTHCPSRHLKCGRRQRRDARAERLGLCPVSR